MPKQKESTLRAKRKHRQREKEDKGRTKCFYRQVTPYVMDKLVAYYNGLMKEAESYKG